MEIENQDNKEISKHKCECCFLKLLLNWRDKIEKKRYNEFILSFPRNFSLKRAFCILYFYDYKQFILNSNFCVLSNKSQFFLEDFTILVAEKTSLINDSFEEFYKYFSKEIKSSNFKKNSGNFNEKIINNLYKIADTKEDDIEYFSKPKIRELLSSKTSLLKRIIDCICLIHNE